MSALPNLSPVAVPLPDSPTDGPFTNANWHTLMAIMDTVIPSIKRNTTTGDELKQLNITDTEYNARMDHISKVMVNPPTNESFDEFLNEKPSDNPRFKSLLERTLIHYSRPDAQKAIAFILSALNTRVGSMLLTGYQTPIHEQPIHIRQTIIQNWRLSYLPPLTAVHSALTKLAKAIWVKTSPSFPRVSGFPVVPNDYKPGKHYKYEFLQFSNASASEPEYIDTDIVIVGSGCGGAVCAKNLAEAGHKVVVVEKGYYFTPEELPMSEESGGIHLFENGAAELTDDGNITIMAGKTWGGGGTVNWSASLQTQDYVRKEWAQDRGLTFFETAEFQTCLDRVYTRMGASTEHVKHNHANRVLLEGSRKLGYSAKAVPQNTGGAVHECGHCTLGCGSAQKQGPVVSWLPDAAKFGAKFVEGFDIDHVIFDESNGTKKAIGVKGKWISRDSKGGVASPTSQRIVREVIVRAKKVIISCGTLWSPIVLLNSGLKNSQIGKNLYLHPVNFVGGVFPEDVRPWEGGILTTVCNTFENLDGRGHGVKLEATCTLPSLFMPIVPWINGLDYKTQMLKYRHTAGYISIARDRDPGRVYRDPATGRPRFAYTPSAFDRASIMEGVIALSKILYVTGATEIIPCILGVDPFVRDAEFIESLVSSDSDPGVTDSAFKAWLEELKRIGNKPPTGQFACAHQMGSNRMSVREKDGVVDPKGRVWGTEGLYVSDASVFPSASGVNPMVTNMAISDWISRGISKELKAEGKRNSKL